MGTKKTRTACICSPEAPPSDLYTKQKKQPVLYHGRASGCSLVYLSIGGFQVP